MSEVIVGLDLGGTNIKTAIVDREGKILGKDSRPTLVEEGLEKVLGRMEEGVNAALADASQQRGDVVAAGIGIPGPLNWRTGMVFSPPNLPGWKNVPIAKLMRERLGVPAYIDNDANVACYGEFWSGAGRGVESMVMLTLGTGVGGGIVVFGKLLRGIDGTAAELGHLCVSRGGRKCNCGAKGCLETYASVTGLVRTAVEGIEKGKKKTILKDMCKGKLKKLTGKMISDAAREGDEFSKWVFVETGRWLGVGIGSMINMLNPEKVVLGGGMIAAGDVLFNSVRETAMSQCFDVPGKRVEIVPAGLGGDAGVIGAAGSALERMG